MDPARLSPALPLHIEGSHLSRVPDFIIDELHRVARVKASLPTVKELAARGQCSVRQVQYHLRKITLREKRLTYSATRNAR